MVRTRFKANFGLVELPHLEDAFSKLLIRHRDSVTAIEGWRAYVACRRDMSAAEAAACLGLDKFAAKHRDVLYHQVGGHMLPASQWSGWSDGLVATGLSSLIELAQKA